MFLAAGSAFGQSPADPRQIARVEPAGLAPAAIDSTPADLAPIDSSAVDPAAPPLVPPATVSPRTAVAWTDLRSFLESRGIAVGFAGTSDLSAIAAGVSGRHEVGRMLADAHADIDLAKLLRVPGGSAFVQYYSMMGRAGSEWAGDIQGFSNIDASSFAHFGEVWYQQAIIPDRLRVKAGRMDANGEFAQVEAAGDFLNASMGYSPAILVFPTYPDPRLGLVVAADPASHFGFSVGTFDISHTCEDVAPTSRHAFVIAEARARWTVGGLDGRIGAGVWRHTGHVLESGEYPAAVAHSPFFTAEQTLWRAADDGDSPRSVSVFAQFATVDENVGIDRHASAGLVWNGPSRRLADDAVGAAVTSVRVASLESGAVQRHSETSVSVFFKHQLTPVLAVQPDVQYIVHPAGIVDNRRTLALTCRLHVEF
jgi:carbohydrate-selective porin OprB